MWIHGHNCQAPMGAGAAQQKACDNIRAGQLAERLLNKPRDEHSRAKLLASATKVHGCMHCQLLRLACAWTMIASGLQLACDWVFQYMVLIHANIVEQNLTP